MLEEMGGKLTSVVAVGVGKVLVVLIRSAEATAAMKRVLRRHLFIGRHSLIERKGGRRGLEVQVVGRPFDLGELAAEIGCAEDSAVPNGFCDPLGVVPLAVDLL